MAVISIHKILLLKFVPLKQIFLTPKRGGFTRPRLIITQIPQITTKKDKFPNKKSIPGRLAPSGMLKFLLDLYSSSFLPLFLRFNTITTPAAAAASNTTAQIPIFAESPVFVPVVDAEVLFAELPE